MEMAVLTAKRSTCLRRKVGAVIVKDKHIIATGYNGAPRGIMHCAERGGCVREKLGVPSGERHELCMALHAEQNAIIQAATDANQFGYIIDSNIKRIRLYISFIRKYDEEINGILESLHELVDANEDADFVKQIHLIETFKGAGFLSAVSIMGEIGDFSAFSKPKQLFAYFGLDPSVKQSGKFEGTKVQMSKRGSAIARRVIHTLTLQSISISRNREAKNPVLREYYLKKCDSKPKLVAMGAVSHKVCNMIFAILRDNKPFKIIAPQEHIKQYNSAKCDIAA